MSYEDLNTTALEQRALSTPNLDYYDEARPRQPKFEIGTYVLEHGFNVPLISTQAEWEQACDDGTAMLRSEHWQDYDGYSGLLRSEVLSRTFDQEQSSEFRREMGALIMRGLRSGEISGEEYMHMSPYSWSWDIEKAYSSANRFGAKLEILAFWPPQQAAGIML